MKWFNFKNKCCWKISIFPLQIRWSNPMYTSPRKRLSFGGSIFLSSYCQEIPNIYSSCSQGSLFLPGLTVLSSMQAVKSTAPFQRAYALLLALPAHFNAFEFIANEIVESTHLQESKYSKSLWVNMSIELVHLCTLCLAVVAEISVSLHVFSHG